MQNPEIVFKHHRETNNLGDAVCSPYEYFDDLSSRGVAMDLARRTPKTRAVVYGGGKIVGGLHKTFGRFDIEAKHRIAWGVSTVQSSVLSLKYWRAFRRLDLVGSRDWGDDRFPWVPCATCMSPLFDRPQPETQDVVLYLHHWKSDAQRVNRSEGVPVLENNNTSLDETIDFLASGRVVVSNSYHGVFWGLILGKKVLCLPFSKKFSHYRIPPGYADPSTWTNEIHKAQGSDELLELCRDASNSFANTVRERIDN